MNPIEVNYQKDHQAIPAYQKETKEQVENKKDMFFCLAHAIADEIPFETHLDVGCGSVIWFPVCEDWEKILSVLRSGICFIQDFSRRLRNLFLKKISLK